MSSLPISSLDDVPGNHDCLVEVKAQVMTRDNIVGMWVPLFRGGMSLVGLYRVSPVIGDGEFCQMQHVIIGHRMSDNAVVLHFVLSPGFQYTKVNPTFHHWAVNDSRYGLTFQTFADASAFERTIAQVMETLKPSDEVLLPLSRNGEVTLQSPSKEPYAKVHEKLHLPVRARHKSSVVDERSTSGDGPCFSSVSANTVEDSHPSILSSKDVPSESIKCTNSAVIQRPACSGICNSSVVGVRASPAVPSVPLRFIDRQHVTDVEPSVCPERPSRSRGPPHEQRPSHAGSLWVDRHSEHLVPNVRIPKGADVVSLPPLPFTPKVIVRSGIDKKRVQTPPPVVPAVPSEAESLVNRFVPASDGRVNLQVHSARGHAVSAARRNNACDEMNSEDYYDDLNQTLMMVPESARTTRDTSVYIPTSYVQFTKEFGNVGPEKNEYLYPNFASAGNPVSQQPAGDPNNAYRDYRNLVKHESIPPLPKKSHSKKAKNSNRKGSLVRTNSANFKSKCRHCGEYFLPKENHRGACADGPDGFKDCLKAETCCAQAVLYHCVDDEDDEGTDLWTCRICERRSCKSWTVLTLLCLILPCMWCFLPLRSCHKCGVACGCCGAKHQQASLPMLV